MAGIWAEPIKAGLQGSLFVEVTLQGSKHCETPQGSLLRDLRSAKPQAQSFFLEFGGRPHWQNEHCNGSKS